ncbi:MAG: uracil-DNA glycosylase family protein [Planctomycetota bacterium]|nr:uracil-DNA glycosylase family protein [Planctomycetota bacterium]
MTLRRLLREIRACDACAAHLPLGARPVLRANPSARILIIGQAPGRRVHESGVAWDDPSGDRLRDWMGISRPQFDAPEIGLVPMGFCYPGTGKTGDLPPRPECKDLWHERLIAMMPAVRLTLLLSRYAHAYVLGDRAKRNLTETVRAWRDYKPRVIPLPHPSPRNNRWLAKNPWFPDDVLPYLRRRVRAVLRDQ